MEVLEENIVERYFTVDGKDIKVEISCIGSNENESCKDECRL